MFCCQNSVFLLVCGLNEYEKVEKILIILKLPFNVHKKINFYVEKVLEMHNGLWYDYGEK